MKKYWWVILFGGVALDDSLNLISISSASFLYCSEVDLLNEFEKNVTSATVFGEHVRRPSKDAVVSLIRLGIDDKGIGTSERDFPEILKNITTIVERWAKS